MRSVLIPEGVRVRRTNKCNHIGGVIEAGTKCCESTEKLTVNLFKGLRKDLKEIITFGLGPER